MRYAVVSDLHSNLEALEAVLKEVQKEGVDQLLCAGDLVGYGPDPAACLERLRKEGVQSVSGNHDLAAVGQMDLEWFNPYARAAAEWTMNHLPEREKQYLKDLPLIRKEGPVTLAHGSLHEPEQFHYLFDPEEAEPSLKLQETPVAFIGHTHVPRIFIQTEEGISLLDAGSIDLDPRSKYLVNVGSVGQPRDRDPRAAWCLYDEKAQHLEIRRVDYPIAQTQAKMRKARLPEFLIERLAYGY